MPYAELFEWWIATITWSIAFPILVSVYLYSHRAVHAPAQKWGRPRWVGDFAFVWFLVGLLVFYIIAVGQDSPALFALGNVVIEALLLLYVFKVSRKRG